MYKTEPERESQLLLEYIVTEKNDAAFLEYNESTEYKLREIKLEDGLSIDNDAIDPTLERGFCVKFSCPVDQTTSHR